MTKDARTREPAWEPGQLQIELDLSEVMFDLDPRWEDWAAPELVTS